VAVLGALLVAMILALALEEKIHARKSVIVAVFAVVALFLADAWHLLPIGPVINAFGERIALPVYIPAVDWGVIAIIVGSSVFVDVSSRSGLFSYVAIRLTKTSGGDPRRLLWYYGALTVVFSALLNNVTAMIIIGSLTGVSLRKLGRQDKLLGFLLIEGLLTNIGGLLTLISSVPNIIVGTAAGISFVRFFLVASPFVLVATVSTLLIGARLFRIERLVGADAEAQARRQVAGFDEHDGVESVGFFWFCAVMTVVFVGGIATASVLPVIDELGMGYVALACATIMLIRYKSEAEQFYRAIDWDLLGFFAALFVVINVMEHGQVLTQIGNVLARVIDLGPMLGGALILVLAAVASSVTDNIPLAAMLAKILKGMGTSPDASLWWSVVFGANLGGNLTPIGSASTLVAVTIIHKQGLELSFVDFVKRAAPYAALQIALATVYVLVFM